MRKSKIVSLVLISSAIITACNNNSNKNKEKKFHMRGDSTAKYQTQRQPHNSNMAWYAFRPYGHYDNSTGSYHSSGRYSSSISEHSNIGHNSTKSSVVRGGFGRSSFSVSS